MSQVFTSFQELAKSMGVSAPEPKAKREKTCRKCGTVLREIPGTNVMLCDGVTKDKKPCGNRVFKNAEFIA